MPVDFIVVLLPLLIIVAALVAATSPRLRKMAAKVAALLMFTFVMIYFVPGCLLMVCAYCGDTNSQYALGVWYWNRCGNYWSDIEARDRWWLRAAEAGHPHAMFQVGYFHRYGSSSVIQKDLAKADFWIHAAAKAGDDDAMTLLRESK